MVAVCNFIDKLCVFDGKMDAVMVFCGYFALFCP